MDRYFLRDVFIFLTYLGAVQWGIHIERSYGCTPTQEVLDFTPRCYSLPIVEDIVSPDSNRCAYSRDGYCDDASLVHGGGRCQAGTDTDDCAVLLALCPAGTDPDCAVKYHQARAAERHGTRHPGFHTNQ
jgi:hypothetical protein